MPLGEPWRVGKRPYGPAALSITAACLKGFYLHQAALGRERGARQGSWTAPGCRRGRTGAGRSWGT